MVQENCVDENESSMCGACIDSCPQKVIQYRFEKADLYALGG